MSTQSAAAVKKIELQRLAPDIPGVPQLQVEAIAIDSRRVTRGALFIALAGLEACLLYTSPSPRDLSTSRMPSSA